MSFALIAFLLIAADAQSPDAVIVAPREFVPALQPLIEHRQQQGHRFAYVSGGGSAESIRGGIRRVAASGALKYVLIVGDAEPATRATPAIAARCVPTHL